MTREAHLVELVDETGQATGSATVTVAHTDPGQLHRAFSVLLFDPDGRTLLQQRSAAKTRFPLRWANTCCGHPSPGTPVTEAARQRLVEELGVTGVELEDVGVYTYRAVDEVTGRVEHEYDHVVIGRVAAGLATTPDPAEVAATRWALPSEIAVDISGPTFAPWVAGVLPIAIAATY